MVKAENNKVMFLNDALKLTDHEDKKIKWEKQEDGSYVGNSERSPVTDQNGKELAGKKFTYIVTPREPEAEVGIIEEQFYKTAKAKK